MSGVGKSFNLSVLSEMGYDLYTFMCDPQRRLEGLSRFFEIIFPPDPGSKVSFAKIIYEDGGRREDACTISLVGAAEYAERGGPRTNRFFAASVFDGTGPWQDANCIAVRAHFVDLDVKAPHRGRNAQCFDSIPDAVSLLATFPSPPTVLWHSGWGVQAAWVLEEAISFTPPSEFEPENASAWRAAVMKRYKRRSEAIVNALGSDHVQSPSHLFRVPLTINDKSAKTPEAEPCRCEWLYIAPHKLYSEEDIQSICEEIYGDEPVDDPPSLKSDRKRSSKPVAPPPVPDDFRMEDEEYLGIPAEIRNFIEYEDHDDRSVAHYQAVKRLYDEGFAEDFTVRAVTRGPQFRRKYGSRQIEDARRCYAKAAARASEDSTCPTSPLNLPEPELIDLEDCHMGDSIMGEYLEKFLASPGISEEKAEEIRDTVRFHQHVWCCHLRGVIDAPCGSGKSIWGKCLALSHSRSRNRFLYVTETVEALYKTAEDMERVGGAGIGRYHSHNSDKCMELRGSSKPHNWRECGDKKHDEGTVCRECRARDKCCFYNRYEEFGRNIVVTTHEQFLRMMERGDGRLGLFHIIVDEAFRNFADAQFRLDDLMELQKAVVDSVDLDLGPLFPHSLLANVDCRDYDADSRYPPTFASQNYVFKDEEHLASLDQIRDNLSKCLADNVLWVSELSSNRTVQQLQETVMDLLAFFRKPANRDSCYSFREISKKSREGKSITYVAKRKRIDLSIRRGPISLWILTASSLLSTYPYPDGMKIYRMRNGPDSSGLVRLHAILRNPTKSNAFENVDASDCQLAGLDEGEMRGVENVFFSLGKRWKDRVDVEAILDRWTDKGLSRPNYVILTRGRINGSNEARHCTIAFLSGMPLFTTLDDCVLYAALSLRASVPLTPNALNKNGKPAIGKNGRMGMREMENYFALRSLDEMYQAIYRAAVRSGGATTAFVVVSNLSWLVTLWRTVMPNFVLAGCSKMRLLNDDEKKEFIRRCDEECSPLIAERRRGYVDEYRVFRPDQFGNGLKLVNNPPGFTIGKKDVARHFGYSGKDGKSGWKDCKKRVVPLLDPFYMDDPEDNTRLVRKDTRSQPLVNPAEVAEDEE